jgi:diaminopimelate decarboxylase
MTAPTVVEPLLSQPRRRLFDCALDVETPSLIYDFPGITRTMQRLQHDMLIVPNAGLNIAAKVCHTPEVLAHLAATGAGADVASVGELELVRAAGFTEITTTGPAFSREHFAIFRSVGVTVDLDSIGQIDLYGRDHPRTDVGLRIRIPLPQALEGNSTFGVNSRFGVSISDPEVHEALDRHGLRLTRLHTHTGQMTPESLLFKVKYTLLAAEAMPGVGVIDLGGGFFGLYVDRGRAVAAFRRMAEMVEAWQQRTGRTISFRCEPGGAVLAAYGYLFTEVRSVEAHHPYHGTRVVTVDTSAWNLAPWHKPTVIPADPDADTAVTAPGRIAGNTLYENDFFGTDVFGRTETFMFPPVVPGDRLVFTASGAYTMTNSRRFNRIPAPAEYAFDGTALSRLTTVPF